MTFSEHFLSVEIFLEWKWAYKLVLEMQSYSWRNSAAAAQIGLNFGKPYPAIPRCMMS
jgi:hypothetical protein